MALNVVTAQRPLLRHLMRTEQRLQDKKHTGANALFFPIVLSGSGLTLLLAAGSTTSFGISVNRAEAGSSSTVTSAKNSLILQVNQKGTFEKQRYSQRCSCTCSSESTLWSRCRIGTHYRSPDTRQVQSPQTKLGYLSWIWLAWLHGAAGE